jgi:hypothetical protein
MVICEKLLYNRKKVYNTLKRRAIYVFKQCAEHRNFRNQKIFQ